MKKWQSKIMVIHGSLYREIIQCDLVYGDTENLWSGLSFILLKSSLT